MKKITWYRYVFTSGECYIVRGRFTKSELAKITVNGVQLVSCEKL